MTSSMLRAAGLALLATTSLPAMAGEWDWQEEFASRHWRPSTIQWAQGISEAPLTADELVEDFDPPAHEMWCMVGAQPTEMDCRTFNDRLDAWLVDFLELDGVGQIPPGLLHFPKECPSSCATR